MNNNSDKFDHLIALAAMKCTEEEAKELKELDTSEVHFDESYYKKKKQIIKKHKRGTFLKTTKVVLIRVAAAIMIMVMLACVFIGCVPELRQAIYNAIVEWYNECFSVRYENTDGQEKETGYVDESTTNIESEVEAPRYHHLRK